MITFGNFFEQENEDFNHREFGLFNLLEDNYFNHHNRVDIFDLGYNIKDKSYDVQLQPKLNFDEDFQVENEYNELNMVIDEDNMNKIDEEEFQQKLPKENGLNIPPKKKIFDIIKAHKNVYLPKYPRVDDCKIYWKTKINKYFIREVNRMISESDLPDGLKKIIHAPNYKNFTEVVTIQKSLEHLQISMNDILTLGSGSLKNQRQNEENINAIKAHYQNNPTESVRKIIELLEMTYEKVIEKFYNSKAFKEFQNDDKAKNFYDPEIKRQKGFSLFDTKKGGLIKLLGKKRKDEQ